MELEKQKVGHSKFYMFRCLIAMAHADGVIADEERAYISAFTNRLDFTEEQLNTIENDFDEAQSVQDLMRHINDPVFRGQVPYFARLMAHKDGNLHPSEDEMLKKMHATAVEGLDLDALKAEAKKATAVDLAVHDIHVDTVGRPQKGGHVIPWFQWFDELLLKMGIDLLRL